MSEINSSRIKLSQLRALVAVAEYENFSEAALHLELSQSAVSHAIASLEDELGVILLLRGRYGAHLTPVGERIVDYARQVLQLLEGMVKAADLEKGLRGGSVRIACFRSIATHVLPAVIVRFRRRFPEITVTITEYPDRFAVEQALREGRADIGFTLLPTSNEFETWEILRDEFIALLPPNQSLSFTNISWEQLTAYPLILPLAHAPCYAAVRQQLQTLELPVNIAYEVGEDSTMVGMVLQGLGATIMPRLAAEPIPPDVQVCRLPVPLERVIGAAMLANTLHTPAVFAFLDTLKDAHCVKTAI